MAEEIQAPVAEPQEVQAEEVANVEKKVKKVTCESCNGRGLANARTLCPDCQGSGKVKK